MTQRKRELEVRHLKVDTMRINKLIEKENKLLSDIGEIILKVLAGESSKGCKNRDITIKNMDKYSHLRRFHVDHQLQVYMYAFMYVYP